MFDEPICTTLNELEESIGSVLNEYAQVESVKAVIDSVELNCSKCVSVDYLSKLWYISEPLAEVVIDQNTQRCRYSSDNVFHVSFRLMIAFLDTAGSKSPSTLKLCFP